MVICTVRRTVRFNEELLNGLTVACTYEHKTFLACGNVGADCVVTMLYSRMLDLIAGLNKFRDRLYADVSNPSYRLDFTPEIAL